MTLDIKELRNEIDAIDQELIRLFCRRMEVTSKIAAYKKENGLPIYHPGREQEVLQKVADLAGSGLRDYAQALYSEIFALSKQYQSAQNGEHGANKEVI